MGIHELVKNNKKSNKARHINRWHRAKKAERKKRMPPVVLNIEDAHLFSVDKMKNKLRNPRNNIAISGKKRNRLTKRLKHDMRERSGMEVKATSSGKRSKRRTDEDEDMGEEETGTVKKQTNEITEEVIKPTSSSKKKKKKGKGKKGSKAANEDVEMEEDWGVGQF